jgi:hypothetical protein
VRPHQDPIAKRQRISAGGAQDRAFHDDALCADDQRHSTVRRENSTVQHAGSRTNGDRAAYDGIRRDPGCRLNRRPGSAVLDEHFRFASSLLGFSLTEATTRLPPFPDHFRLR